MDDLSTGQAEGLPRGAELILGDVRSRPAVRAAAQGVDAILHLAARPGVPRSMRDPIGTTAVNVHGTAVVVAVCQRLGLRRLVYASSSAVYGNQAAGLAGEHLPSRPASPYAATKVSGEAMLAAGAADGLDPVALRYFNVYGPSQSAWGLDAPVVPRFVLAARAGKALPLEGDGHQGRDFVHVRDVARANALALELPARRDGRLCVLNVGTGRSTSVRALGQAICQMAGQPPLFAALAPRRGDVRDSRADVRRVAAVLGWRARLGLEEGLRSVISAQAASPERDARSLTLP